jgi:bifunctional DNase/RNase
VNMTNYKRVVMLKEKTGQRFLPIWIGHFEADAIAIPMQNVPVSRPLTHDVLAGLAPILGWRWARAVISELSNETFYATLVLERGGERASIDVRPSDAISVAIRAKIPLFVEDDVLDKAAMRFDSKAPSPSGPSSLEQGSESDESGPGQGSQ